MPLKSHNSKINGDIAILLFYIIINKIKQQITENNENLFFHVVTLRRILHSSVLPVQQFCEALKHRAAIALKDPLSKKKAKIGNRYNQVPHTEHHMRK